MVVVGITRKLKCPSVTQCSTVPIASKATRVREYEYNIAQVRVPRVRVQVSSLIKKCEYYHASTRVELLASTREYNICEYSREAVLFFEE